jgi:hypothetical protein
MPLTKFVEASADRQESIEDLAKKKAPEIKERFDYLVNNPSDINPVILDDFLVDGYEVMVAETGNEELAQAYWDQVAVMVETSLDILAQTPVEQRGDVWNSAVSILVSAAQIQAEIESGMVAESAVIGIESGKELRSITKDIPNDKLKEATFNIKPELKKRKKEKKAKDGSN